MDDNRVWAGDRVVGIIENGVFIQQITRRHIYWAMNAKGLDVHVYTHLQGQCHTWRLVFTDTKQVLSIGMEKVKIVGVKRDLGPRAGIQYMVKLADFSEEQTTLQGSLL